MAAPGSCCWKTEWMRNLRLFISEGPEMVWLLFREQNQLSPHGESGPLCRLLPCQKHLVGFGMLLNSASAVPIRGPHDVQDALETPCPSAPGARGALPGGASEGMAGCEAYTGTFCCTGNCLGPQIPHSSWAADLIAPGMLPSS